MRPLDFYRLGTKTAQTARTEAEFRTAIGRLYYGLHHETCCRYFRENPRAGPLTPGRRHSQLIENLKVPGNAITGRIWPLLNQLRRMRNVADYELASPVRYGTLADDSSQFLMGFAMTVANELLEALDDYSEGEVPDGCECPSARWAV